MAGLIFTFKRQAQIPLLLARVAQPRHGSVSALGQGLDLFRFYLKPPALLKMT